MKIPPGGQAIPCASVIRRATPIGSGSLVRLTYTDPTGSDDTNALQGATGADVASFAFASGIVADGYVRGAQIFIDANGNGVAESGEALAGVLTDANGNFFLPPGAPVGAVIAVGGINIDTGVVNTLALRAPAGAGGHEIGLRLRHLRALHHELFELRFAREFAARVHRVVGCWRDDDL